MIKAVERQRNILELVISSLLRRTGKNVALLVAYTLVVFSLASVMFFTQAIKREASILLTGSPEIIIQKLVAGRHDLIPLSYADRIKRIRGVESVQGRLWGYYFDQTARANYTLMVPQGLALGEEDIAIGGAIARVHELARGHRISFRSGDGQVLSFSIKGVFSPESELLSADLILISEAGFRRVFGVGADYATDLAVKVRNVKEIPTIAAKIADILPDTRPIQRGEILRTYEAVFDWRGGLLLVVLAGALLAFLIFAWDKAAGLSAEEKREIGILKAIGWETADILQMKFWEGVVISISSFLLGVLLAYFHVFLTSAPLLTPVLKGWSTLYPEFQLTPRIDAYQIAILFFLTVIPYTTATIIPSWRTATIDPDLVMRT